MASNKLKGMNAKVTLGSTAVPGMGNWTLNGVKADQLETTSFGDTWKQFEAGLLDGGTATFAGFFQANDVTGQQKLIEANLYGSQLTTVKFYINATSYYEPCQTTGYFSPNLTTGAPTLPSSLLIDTYSVKADKSQMISVDFSAKISGVMVLV